MGTDIQSIVKLDKAVFETAIEDLKSSDLSEIESAALYFFPDGAMIDESNPKSFTSFCKRYGVNPDIIAKRVWDSLAKERQKLILKILTNAGCYQGLV